MRPYEVMVIFDVGTEPPAIQAAVDRLLETVRNNGGTPGAVDRWGRRPFAYEVKHKREGYYVLVEFAGESQTVAELDRFLGLADEVLRHKVVRLPEKATEAGRRRVDRWPDPDWRRGGRAGRAAGVDPSDGRGARRSTMPDNSVTLVGNVTRDPELRFTNTGQPTASFGLAVNRRWQNRQTQEWEEATSFFDVVCWREMAENVSESLTRGARVVVAGRLEQRSWETPDGDRRSKVEVIADEVGPSLRWAPAQMTKNERRGPAGGGGSGGGRAAAAGSRRRSGTRSRRPGGRRVQRGAFLMARSNFRGGTAPSGTQGPEPAGEEKALCHSAGTTSSGSTTRTSRCSAST